MERRIPKGTINAQECLGVGAIHLITGTPRQTGVRNGPSAQHEVKYASKVAGEREFAISGGWLLELTEAELDKECEKPACNCAPSFDTPVHGRKRTLVGLLE